MAGLIKTDSLEGFVETDNRASYRNQAEKKVKKEARSYG